MATSSIEDIDRHISKRYEVGIKLGKGAYGIVWRAIDKRSKETCALKKIFDAFQNSTDAQRTFREVMLLQRMRGHANIITLLNVLKADNDRDLYLVFEFMDTDLNAAVKANILEDVHKQYIMYQCFDALRHMHACELVHRDLKPANLLLNAACLMKVCDFGLARSVASWNEDAAEREALMTDYVATRWYRAPEILVGSYAYAYAVDLWSVGCILAECLHGRPFFTGSTTMNQIEKIMEVLGKPTTEEVDAWKCPFAKTMIDSCMPPASRSPSPVPTRSSSPGPAPEASPSAAQPPEPLPAASHDKGVEQQGAHRSGGGDASASRMPTDASTGAAPAAAAPAPAGGIADADADADAATDAASGAASSVAAGGDSRGGEQDQGPVDVTAKAEKEAEAATEAKDFAAAARRDAKQAAFRKALPHAPPDAISLLSSLLCYNPRERLTAEEAMKVPYCSQGAWVQSPEEPPLHSRGQSGKPKPVAEALKFTDSVKRHTSDYRQGIYELIDRMAAEEPGGKKGQ